MVANPKDIGGGVCLIGE